MNRGFTSVWLVVGLVVIIGGLFAWQATTQKSSATNSGTTESPTMQQNTDTETTARNRSAESSKPTLTNPMVAAPTTGSAPLAVNFSTLVSIDSKYLIDFGDGHNLF